MTATPAPATMSAADAEAQLLASGTVGPALLAIERALHGDSDWTEARRLITHVTTGPVDASAHAGLFYGAPAIAFMLHTTTADGRGRYLTARHNIDQHVRRLTRERLATAHQRIRVGHHATFAEYDLFYGLVGLGALLLRQSPHSDELGGILRYVVRLTEPRHDGVPGWWVDHDPDATLPTRGGHANNGMAHGAAGLLVFLAHATRYGHHVDGQIDAIHRLCAWFDRWQQDSPHGRWWPQWITRDQLHTGETIQHHPGKPSWCYGAAGIARAQQLAAIATHDHARRAAAEDALAACLTRTQVDRLTDAGICHGLAGLYQTAYRAAADATTPAIAQRLSALAARLIRHPNRPRDAGLLTGHTGVDLALLTASTGAPHTRWDTCLLIT